MTRAWIAVDWAVALYTLGIGVLVVVCARAVPYWPQLALAHALLLAFVLWLPARGARWERVRSTDTAWQRGARRVGRFLRYTYPAILLTPFFEEVRFTVNATSPGDPYWFEPWLYAADRMLFGATPAVAISQGSSPILDEVMHALYFSYYPLIVGGIVIAWMGGRRGAPAPGPGFHAAMTSMMLGFFFAYAWYPFVPARGPWENRELMAGVSRFEGYVFTPLVQWIIDRAAVSGGCFPSAHVAGTWGLTVGLAPAHRKSAVLFAAVAVGLGIACVYTRYHHAVDVLAGFVVGVAGGAVGMELVRPKPDTTNRSG